MVANTTLLNIHQRLKEIFVTPNSKLFAGVSILAVGDLYQLPPIRKKPAFENYKNDCYNLCHPWHVFKMIELIEIMRQKDDKEFSDLLNRIRTASQSPRGDLLQYLSYTGTCRPSGYGFSTVRS